MKNACCLAVVVFVFWGMAFPEAASAQLFRRWQDNSQSDNYSNLPGADPMARRAPDYGAEQVSEEIRNEVNGRIPVRPAPDFMSNSPLAITAKIWQPPAFHTVQRPVIPKDVIRVQPPVTNSARLGERGPHWLDEYLNRTENTEIGDLPPQTPEKQLEPGNLGHQRTFSIPITPR